MRARCLAHLIQNTVTISGEDYLLTAWCRVLLEKLTGLQLVKKFPAFHGTRKFITALTSVLPAYLVRITDLKAPRFVVFANLLLYVASKVYPDVGVARQPARFSLHG